jgi:hypothetical protein
MNSCTGEVTFFTGNKKSWTDNMAQLDQSIEIKWYSQRIKRRKPPCILVEHFLRPTSRRLLRLQNKNSWMSLNYCFVSCCSYLVVRSQLCFDTSTDDDTEMQYPYWYRYYELNMNYEWIKYDLIKRVFMTSRWVSILTGTQWVMLDPAFSST